MKEESYRYYLGIIKTIKTFFENEDFTEYKQYITETIDT
jgi:hypothetical protein